MFIRLLYKDANFHIYKIDENGSIKKNDEVLSPDDIIYHSTNGYDYVLLEKFDGTLTMYPLDKVVYNSFYPEIINLGNHLKCIHLNCDLRDNRLENLKGIKEEEEWRTITYPGIRPNTYKVSQFGNVMSLTNYGDRVFLKGYTSIADNHVRLQLCCDNNIRNKPIMVLLHRIVVHEFIGDIKRNLCINHIDGDPTNNELSNLEIVTYSQNTKHAFILGLEKPMCDENHYKTRITNDLVRLVLDVLIKNNGNAKSTEKEIHDMGLTFITYDAIFSIKHKKSHKHFIESEYPNLKFEPEIKPYLTDDEINRICITLAKNNGGIKQTMIDVNTELGYNRVSFDDVKDIKYKQRSSSISDKYFSYEAGEFKVKQRDQF